MTNVQKNQDMLDHLSELWVLGCPLYDEKADIVAGLHELFTTVAIMFDVSETGYAERYCFLSESRALIELAAWHNRGFDDQRPTGWIACRGVSANEVEHSMLQYHGKDYAQAVELLADKKTNGLRIVSKPLEQEIADELNMTFEDVTHQVAYLRLIGKLI